MDTVVSPDSRGFVVGAPVAYLLGAGFALARRVDVLPWETISAEYTSHRGRNIIEMHTDAVAPGERVLIVDDLLATGGTVSATARLVRKLGGEVVGVGSLIELGSHGGRERLRDFRVESVIRYE